MVIIFFVVFFQPRKSFQEPSAFSQAKQKVHLVLRCIRAWHLLVKDSFLGSQINSLLLLRLGNTSLLGNGEVAGSLWALR